MDGQNGLRQIINKNIDDCVLFMFALLLNIILLNLHSVIWNEELLFWGYIADFHHVRTSENLK